MNIFNFELIKLYKGNFFMNIKKKARLSLIICITTLYFLILIIDVLYGNISSNISILLKYLCILLCFSISLLIGKDYIYKEDCFLLQTGLFFTLCADFCLLIKNNFICGILFFCGVQSIHIIRYSKSINSKYTKSKISNKNRIIIKALIISLLVILILIIPSLNEKILFIIGIIYAALLLTSTFRGIKTINHSVYPKRNAYLIGIGMILFLLCDTNVALNFILQNYQIGSLSTMNIKFLVSYLIWLFYIPSQLLLSLSGHIYLIEN